MVRSSRIAGAMSMAFCTLGMYRFFVGADGRLLFFDCDNLLFGLVAQLVRAPPCHGGGREFKSLPGRFFCF